MKTDDRNMRTTRECSDNKKEGSQNMQNKRKIRVQKELEKSRIKHSQRHTEIATWRETERDRNRKREKEREY